MSIFHTEHFFFDENDLKNIFFTTQKQLQMLNLGLMNSAMFPIFITVY